jgi:hypothetical protein
MVVIKKKKKHEQIKNSTLGTSKIASIIYYYNHTGVNGGAWGEGMASSRKFAETERARRAGARGPPRKRQPLPTENKLVGGRDVTSSNDASAGDAGAVVTAAVGRW